MKPAPTTDNISFPHGFLDFLSQSPGRRHQIGDCDLSAERLAHFNAALRRISADAPPLTMDQIATAARRVLSRNHDGQRPAFVESRLQALLRLEEMAANRNWQLPAEDCERIAVLRAYVNEPEGLLPDRYPVIGQLDDAVLIDLCLQLLHDELADYEDYCRFCQVAADFAGTEVSEVGLTREHWLEALRQAYDEQPPRASARLYVPDPRSSLFHIH